MVSAPHVTVTLPRRLVQRPSIEANLKRSISMELDGLASDVQLKRPPTVEVLADDWEPGATGLDMPVRIDVDGRRCVYPRQLPYDGLGYARGVPPLPEASASGAPPLSENPGPETVEAVAILCRAALAAQPDLLGAEEHVGEARDVEVRLEPGLLRSLIDQDPEGQLFPLLRDGLLQQLGLVLPDFHLRPDPSLRPRGVVFRVLGRRSMPRIAPTPTTILVGATPESMAGFGLDPVATCNPATSEPASLVAAEHRTLCEAWGLTVWNTGEYVILALAAALRAAAPSLVNVDMLGDLLERVGWGYPDVATAASSRLRTEDIAEVLRDLLADGISVRNMRRILELMLQFDVRAGRTTDCNVYVRHGLADLISYTASRGSGVLSALLLDPEMEASLSAVDETAEHDEFEVVEAVLAAVAELTAGTQPVAVLTSDETRPRLARLLRPVLPQVRVVGHGDLRGDITVRPVGWVKPPSAAT